ncbi:MAG: hypothetical protein ACYCTH_07250 [Cellulomonas sp.]
MRLDASIPDALEPGQRWTLNQDDLPPGVAGLRIGDVLTINRSDGRPVPLLVDTARRVDGERVYDLIALADRIDITHAQDVLDALVDHATATGTRVTITQGRTDIATIVPIRSASRPPAPQGGPVTVNVGADVVRLDRTDTDTLHAYVTQHPQLALNAALSAAIKLLAD